MNAKLGFWTNRQYHLNKMSLRELVLAYIQYYAIQVYFWLAVGCITFVVLNTTSWLRTGAVVSAVLVVYPLSWYLLHRFVLHGRYLFRSPLTSRIWKRIHFDHHQDPHDLKVLFGALYTTLPTILGITGSVGWLIDGWSGAAAGIGTGLIQTCFYEFCHCTQHLSFKPKSVFFKKIKRLHLFHHFHNEQGNYGITNFTWDRVIGTFYTKEDQVPRSATVFNLGYTQEMAQDYPWVARMSKGWDAATPRERRKQLLHS